MDTAIFSCVVVGEETLLVECTRLLIARGHTVSAVVSSSVEIQDWARREGLQTIEFCPELADKLAPLDCDYLFSIANLKILPEKVLKLPSKLPINFHDGPLPRHAGLFATSWAILEGDTEHGVTWHVMSREADTGDILLQRMVSVDSSMTVRELDVACFEAGIESFGDLIDQLAAGTSTRTPQDFSLRTYHAKYDGLPRAGVFSWQRSGWELEAAVRATAFENRKNEFGSALLALGDQLVVVRGVEVSDEVSEAAPGTVVDYDALSITVATGDRDIHLTSILNWTGEPIDLPSLAECVVQNHGGRFTELSSFAIAKLEEASRAALREERRWLRTLRALEPIFLPRFGELAQPSAAKEDIVVPKELYIDEQGLDELALAAVSAFLSRLCRDNETSISLSVPCSGAKSLLVTNVPFQVPQGWESMRLSEFVAQVSIELDDLRTRSRYRKDILLRHPSLAGAARREMPVCVVLPGGDDVSSSERELTVRIGAQGEVSFDGGTALSSIQVDWLAERYRLFLASVVENPQQSLGEVLLLSTAEQALLYEWNDTAESYPTKSTVSLLVSQRAHTSPTTLAVRCESVELNYAELDEAANRLAWRLIDLGAQKGALVGIYLERSVDLMIGLLAVMKTGAAYVPIDPIYPPSRIEHMLDDSGACLVLTNESLGQTIDSSSAKSVFIGSDEKTPEAPIVAVDRSEPDAAVYVIYTSGSTGKPKGVQVGHRALVNFLWTMARRPGFTADDSLLALTTICFDIAGLELYLPLICGGVVEVLPSGVAADGVALREWIERTTPTVVQATPTTWKMLIAAGWPGDKNLRALCGGEAMPAELASELPHYVGELYNMYGPTETTIWSTIDRIKPGSHVTIGRPIGNTRCYVFDQRKMLVPLGIPGELYLSGDGVADGYLGRPELSDRRFVIEPQEGERAYRTGDMVRYLPDGRLEYLERMDGQVKINGYRIELGEVECALRMTESVSEAVAMVRADINGEKKLVAYVTGDDDALVPSEIRANVGNSLPSYMVPSMVMVLSRFPLTPNGKVDRAALPLPRIERVAGGDAQIRTETENQISEIWCHILGLDWVGAEDNFFDLGGNSLKLTSVVAMLRERVSRPVTRLSMFTYPTIRAMAAYLSDDASPVTTSRRRSRDLGALTDRRSRIHQSRRKSTARNRL